MFQLPDRPDLEQLRRQARELLRAALSDRPSAVNRIRSVGNSTTYATAQLVLAREYGFSNWAALKTEVDRRILLTDSGVESEMSKTHGRRSYGGASRLETSEGLLTLGLLLVKLDEATLQAWFAPAPSEEGIERARVRPIGGRSDAGKVESATRVLGPLEAVDDQGEFHTLHIRRSGNSLSEGPNGAIDGLVREWPLELKILPPLSRDCSWLELRSSIAVRPVVSVTSSRSEDESDRV